MRCYLDKDSIKDKYVFRKTKGKHVQQKGQSVRQEDQRSGSKENKSPRTENKKGEKPKVKSIAEPTNGHSGSDQRMPKLGLPREKKTIEHSLGRGKMYYVGGICGEEQKRWSGAGNGGDGGNQSTRSTQKG